MAEGNMIRVSVGVLAAMMVTGSLMVALAGDAENCTNVEALLKANPEKAVSACRRLAEQGEAWAQFKLGEIYDNMYDSGEAVPQNFAEAAKWYRKAAEQGDATAQYNLFAMYHRGQGVHRDDAEALRWLRKAVDQDYSEAQRALGLSYLDGWGVSQNFAEAMKWLSLTESESRRPGAAGFWY
jgi:uncharacterized protein